MSHEQEKAEGWPAMMQWDRTTSSQHQPTWFSSALKRAMRGRGHVFSGHFMPFCDCLNGHFFDHRCTIRGEKGRSVIAQPYTEKQESVEIEHDAAATLFAFQIDCELEIIRPGIWHEDTTTYIFKNNRKSQPLLDSEKRDFLEHYISLAGGLSCWRGNQMDLGLYPIANKYEDGAEMFNLMEKFPDLCYNGFLSITGNKKIEEVIGLKVDLLKASDEIRLARSWIKSNCTHSKRIRSWEGSYRLKHRVEQSVRRYISNGALIAGFILEGFRVFRESNHSPNCYFNFKPRDAKS